MGLLDSLLGANAADVPAGTTPPSGHAVIAAIGDLINQHGGLSGLASQFHQKGLGDLFSSWVQTGPNQPVSPDQVHQVVGSDQVSAIAQKLGINPALAATLVAQFLPKIIDHLTANGRVEPEHDQPNTLQSLLQSGLGKLLGG